MSAVPIADQPSPSAAVAAFLKRKPQDVDRAVKAARAALESKSVCMLV